MSTYLEPQTRTTVVPSSGELAPIGIDAISVLGGFWAAKQALNATAIIPHALEWEKRVGWIDNFVHVHEGTIADKRRGREFSDSDVYKLIEAMAWEVGRTGDASLEAEIQRLGALIERVQETDGYVDTKFGHDGQAPRYTNFEWGHELYCFGHLIQAAVARLRCGAGAGDVIPRIARRVADHVCATFGDGGLERIPGHPEIEVALAEFGRALGEERYIEQARIFIDRRGRGLLPEIEYGSAYFQDDIAFRDAEVLRGHCVRALYLTAGAIDVAVEQNDEELLRIARAQFDSTWATRTYLTGGMGSHHQDEAFGADFELPPDRAYSETCAAIGAVMVAWRLLLATGDEHYADVIERCLFNVVSASPAEDGRSFFYANTLHRRTTAVPAASDVPSPRADSQLRAPWFDVSCCPTNVARTLASFSSFIATTDSEGLQIHQYADAEIRADIAGASVALRLETAYPESGRIRITRTDSGSDRVALKVRVPKWATRARVGGVDAETGAFVVPDGIGAGETIEVDLTMDATAVVADPRIDAVRGCFAVERGPLVLCLESVDLPAGIEVGDVEIAADSLMDDGSGASIEVIVRRLADAAWPYPTDSRRGEQAERMRVPLTPYYRWGNRGPTTMRVWLPLAGD